MTWNATSTGRSKLVTSHPKAALEALADHVEGDWVDAGVDGGHVDANVVQHQEEAKRTTLRQPACGIVRHLHHNPLVPEQLTAIWILLVVNGELQDAAEVERQPAQSEDQDQAEHCLGNLPSLDSQIKARTPWINRLNESYVLRSYYESGRLKCHLTCFR